MHPFTGKVRFPNAAHWILPFLMAGTYACSSAQTGNVGYSASGTKPNRSQDGAGEPSEVLNKIQVPNDSALAPAPAPTRDLSLAKLPTDSEAADIIRSDFNANNQSADIIYVDIRHLSQKDTGTNELEAYRYGIAKTLNSISVAPSVVKLAPLDSAETIFRVKLSDYTLASSWPIILRDKRAKANVSQNGGSTIVKGDWLVFAATRPEIYNSVMRIPGNVNGLEAEFGADYNKAVYINAPESTVTFNGRVMQRIPIDVGGKPGGYYWRTYDPVGRPLENLAFSNPEAMRFATLPTLYAGEYFFSLPNGLQGYSLSGFVFQTRLDAQLFAATDPRRPQDGLTTCAGGAKNCGYVLNGESCMTCHASGVNQPIKFMGLKGIANEKAAQDLITQDRERFASALKEMGYTNYQGAEPILETITAFKNRTKDVDKRVQAGEFEGASNNRGMFQRK
ncbi:MAG: hypothetical protein FJ146_16580 [Deltaproteobacteria bacterium]|nr:hypothetical protein [Deltaproteobacteria bacterium]